MLADRGRIDTLENYARFYLPDLLKGVEAAVYLDADTVTADGAGGLRFCQRGVAVSLSVPLQKCIRTPQLLHGSESHREALQSV